MKKIIGAIAIIALAVIVGIGAGYYFTHQNSGSPQNASTTSSTATISEAEAQQIALEDAGLAEADVSFTKTKLDRDDGVNEWSVDFATQDTEYDYEIAAADGSIMKSEREPYRP